MSAFTIAMMFNALPIIAVTMMPPILALGFLFSKGELF